MDCPQGTGEDRGAKLAAAESAVQDTAPRGEQCCCRLEWEGVARTTVLYQQLNAVRASDDGRGRRRDDGVNPAYYDDGEPPAADDDGGCHAATPYGGHDDGGRWHVRTAAHDEAATIYGE